MKRERFLSEFKSIIVIITCAFCFTCEDHTTNPYQNSEVELCYRKLDSNSRWQIFTNNRFGNNQKNISNNPFDDAYNPLWTPDGKYIAFRYDRENAGGCDIYLYDNTNNSKINVTSDFEIGESAYPILWSPDSEKLIYHYHKMGEPFYYYIMNSDGTEKQILFETESVYFIDFSDHGNSLLYTKDELLYRINIATKSSELILDFKENSVYPAWVDGYDPINHTVLCHEDSSSWNGGATFLIKRINLTTKKSDTLVIAENGIKFLRPVFSREYSKVAYIERDYENDISKIILLDDSEKTELNRLTDENESYSFYNIEFSPNNTYITYTLSENIPGEVMRSYSYVYVLNISTKETRLIDQAEDSHWNPLINF
ncbi:MAG: PD40 domain-containing protein [Calditrichaceae bacterium]|nr:PD40 domain-containing protein [Calditrichaceae bacterium]MBN2710714.1 PD40 domain-containing protein [Calditrichaceae bacterium]RQV92743.1 MAG: hypothetical protein EH224_14520 [Calditrichota bacterium]